MTVPIPIRRQYSAKYLNFAYTAMLITTYIEINPQKGYNGTYNIVT